MEVDSGGVRQVKVSVLFDQHESKRPSASDVSMKRTSNLDPPLRICEGVLSRRSLKGVTTTQELDPDP